MANHQSPGIKSNTGAKQMKRAKSKPNTTTILNAISLRPTCVPTQCDLHQAINTTSSSHQRSTHMYASSCIPCGFIISGASHTVRNHKHRIAKEQSRTNSPGQNTTNATPRTRAEQMRTKESRGSSSLHPHDDRSKFTVSI